MKNNAQTFVEYTLLFGVLISLLLAMTPAVRRGIQGMVRSVADRVGNQQAADQVGGKSGQLDDVYTSTRIDREKNVQEFLGDTTYTFNEELSTESDVSINQGFTKQN